MPEPVPPGATDRIVVAGGCFWCTEAVFSELRGVRSVVPGYAGGTVPDPSYEQVCTGTTGHAEAVEVTFDPSELSLHDLLVVFFTTHDPTTRDRQGPDTGTQYRSAVFYRRPEQKAVVEAVVREVTDERLYRHPVVTEIALLAAFYPAEEYHRAYYQRHPERGYCQAVIAPKLAKFRKAHSERLRSAAPGAPALSR
jgi:peptide-methionine (S)-S-oxide reductase